MLVRILHWTKHVNLLNNTCINTQNTTTVTIIAIKETRTAHHRFFRTKRYVYFFPKNILFCSTLGTTRTVREMRDFVLRSCEPSLNAPHDDKLANVSSMTSVVTSRMPCKYFVYMSSLTITRLRGISRMDAKRRASSDDALNSHCTQAVTSTNCRYIVLCYLHYIRVIYTVSQKTHAILLWR